MPTSQLKQQVNVWRLNNSNVGLVILSSASPTTEIIEKLSAAREQCERLVAVLNPVAEENELLWAHSETLDALSFAEKNELASVKEIDATLILEE